MTKQQFESLREQEPWLNLREWESYLPETQASILATPFEEALVKRAAKILASDYVNSRGDCIFTPKP